MSTAWVVHKFGGTSLANAERYRQVAAIMRAEKSARKVIIVSAMAKVTDTLIALVDLAKARTIPTWRLPTRSRRGTSRLSRRCCHSKKHFPRRWSATFATSKKSCAAFT